MEMTDPDKQQKLLQIQEFLRGTERAAKIVLKHADSHDKLAAPKTAQVLREIADEIRRIGDD